MTNNFTPKKSGTVARPQLSPEEYAAKKKAEKDAVYQMIDDTATEIVSDPDKFRAYLDTQARMDRYSAARRLGRRCGHCRNLLDCFDLRLCFRGVLLRRGLRNGNVDADSRAGDQR